MQRVCRTDREGGADVGDGDDPGRVRAPARSCSRGPLHEHSPRAGNRFVAINCAAIPGESAGERALRLREGRVHGRHAADAGQDRGCQRRHAVPRRDRRPADVAAGEAAALPAGAGDRARRRAPGDRRSTCASSAPRTRTSRTTSSTGRFREDLYYRLAEIVVEHPAAARAPRRRRAARACVRAPLRRRAEASATLTLLPDAIAAIEAHAWPGNVRELENVIKRAVIMVDGSIITAATSGWTTPRRGARSTCARSATKRRRTPSSRRSAA